MKRLVFILPVLGILSACSASGGAAAKPAADMPFSAEAVISYSGEECKARIYRFESGSWEFCMTEPYAAEGLVITVNGGETKLKMYDMESISDINAEAVSMARAVVTAYDAAVSSGDAAKDENGAVYVSGSSDLGTYKLCFGEDMMPVSLSADSGHLKADITGFAVLEAEDEDDVKLDE